MRGIVSVYRPCSSALHATRPGAAIAYCTSFALAAVLFEHPLVLGAAAGGIVLAARGAGVGVGGEVRRAARAAVPLALLFALLNPLITSEGRTLLMRGWVLFGHRFDITLEALAYGGVSGARILVLILAFALFSAAVDPDDVLRMLRRVGYRSALTASLATRLVPVLARDASRMSDAAQCRPESAPRAAVARATLTGALERAVEVAASLEVRGYSRAVRPARELRPWSRHDVRVGAAAAVAVGIAVAAKLAGAGGFAAYPEIELALGPAEALLCATLLAAGALPFAGASTRLGVARA